MRDRIFRRGGMIAAATLAASLVSFAPSPAAATACPTPEQIRAKVAALVDQIRPDVPSRAARAAVRAELVQSMRTFRGAKATTAAQRAALGQAISALAKQLSSATSRVQRKALVAQILALTEQRERGPFTLEERAELRAANRAVRDAVVARLDTPAEIRAITVQFRAIHESFTC